MIQFVIGTRAQLFKMAPIMRECQQRKLRWRWIYTAQHKETIAETLRTFGLPEPDYVVVKWETEAKTMIKAGYWLTRIMLALFHGRKILGGYTGKNSIVLTHGDTTTTWWAALLGRMHRCKVMHVESGLRSFNFFRPFPEEINRLITFRLANYYACPGKWAVNNLRKYRGEKINVGVNTQYDTIQFGIAHCDSAKIKLPRQPYTVASIHRFENIFTKERFTQIIDALEDISKQFTVLLVQHPATAVQLKKYGLDKRLAGNQNVWLLPRLEYLPFIKAVKHSQFVISDGGGNQEELAYIGKPTLIFRNETERKEGLGANAVLSKFDEGTIKDFLANYSKYQTTPVKVRQSPSQIIVRRLIQLGYGK